MIRLLCGYSGRNCDLRKDKCRRCQYRYPLPKRRRKRSPTGTAALIFQEQRNGWLHKTFS